MFLIIHFVMWSLILVLIECGCLKFVHEGIIKLLSKNKIDSNPIIQYGDEDVREEEIRIKLSKPSNIKVRVLDFKKVYPSIVG